MKQWFGMGSSNTSESLRRGKNIGGITDGPKPLLNLWRMKTVRKS